MPRFSSSGHSAPGIRAADSLPCVLRPGVIAEFTGMRHGVKGPDHLPGEDVVSANVAGTGLVFFVGRRTQDQKIFKYPAGIGRLNQRQTIRIASQTFPQIDPAVLAKSKIDLPVLASISCKKLLAANSSLRSEPSALCQ